MTTKRPPRSIPQPLDADHPFVRTLIAKHHQASGVQDQAETDGHVRGTSYAAGRVAGLTEALGVFLGKGETEVAEIIATAG